MKVIEHIQKAKSTLFTIEILPPKKGENIDTLFTHVESLLEFEPSFIDVTYHREEYIYKEQTDGSYKKSITRKRPGTVGICAAIQNRYNIDTVPHLICGGFSKEDTENMLIELDFLGIENVLALRGDPIKSEPGFTAHPDGHCYASELIKQVKDMNRGVYLNSELEEASPTNFCIGAAGYPEKHFESPSRDIDFKHLKMKVDNGAQFIVTQMFFNNQAYFDFVKLCREHNIHVPIIPGLKPIATLKHLSLLPQFFHLDIPEALAHEVAKCKDNKEVKEVGVDWCVQQCKELIDFGAPVLHFYTMSRSELVKRVAKEVF